MSRPEIIELTPDRDWNPNSIHLILNNMIEKGVIAVDGLTRCGRGYGRTYVAVVSNLEFAMDVLKSVTPDMTTDERFIGAVRALLAEHPSPEAVEAVKKLL